MVGSSWEIEALIPNILKSIAIPFTLMTFLKLKHN